jgi:hypothetical protein
MVGPVLVLVLFFKVGILEHELGLVLLLKKKGVEEVVEGEFLEKQQFELEGNEK